MKKRFGQHLLVDKNHLRKIINTINLSQNDIVLEIGAGSGLLTCELAKEVKKILAVEYERSILEKLKVNLQINKLKNVEIVSSNFLKLDLDELLKEPVIVVANIPYNITSKILIKLFGEIDKPAPYLKFLKKVYLMLQLEVAQRVTSKPGTKAYSPLTLLVQYFTEPEILYKVPSRAFFPVPKVDSAFVLFNIKNKLQESKNPPLLKSIIRTCFEQRRKKIINSISRLCSNKNQTIKIFNDIGLDYNLRAEDLNLNQYMLISDSLADCKRLDA